MAECLSCGAVIGAGSANATMCVACSEDDTAITSDDSASFSWQAPTSPEHEGQGGGQSEVVEAGVEAQGSHWQAGESKPAVADDSEQQQPSSGGGSLLGRLISMVCGVIFIVTGIGGLVLASGAVPPSGDGQARDALAYHYAQPMGWFFLVVGVVLIVAPVLRSPTSAAGKTRRSSAYRWLPAGVVLYYLSWPAGLLIVSSVPQEGPVAISSALLLAVWLLGMAGMLMVLVGLVYFFGDYLEDSGLYPRSRSDWIKIMVVFWVLVGITESLIAGIVLLAVLGPGLALLRSESKKEKRAKESQADG